MNIRIIVLTLLFIFVGFVLEHLPLPPLLSWLQVPWVVLLVSLLVLQAPQNFTYWLAIPLGLLLDVEQQQLLGLNVLILLLHISVLQVLFRSLRRFNDLLLTLIMVCLIGAEQLLKISIAWLLGSDEQYLMLAPMLGTALMWLLLRASFLFLNIRLNRS